MRAVFLPLSVVSAGSSAGLLAPLLPVSLSLFGCLTGLVLTGLVLSASTALGEDGYLACFESGRRLSGPVVQGWADPEDRPTLGGQPLLGTRNGLRWLRQTGLKAGRTPSGVIELFNGDRLPGVVVGYCQRQAWPARPPCLVVVPLVPLANSRLEKVASLHILPQMVRRWWFAPGGLSSPQGPPLVPPWEPGSLQTRGGRKITFRSLAFQAGGVRVLSNEGVFQVPFSELAWLQLPVADVWGLYCDQVASLSPKWAEWTEAVNPDRAFSELVHVETVDGFSATTSTARYRPLPLSSRGDADRWFHLIQPAWSLDAVALPHGRIRLRYYFPAHEVPLAQIPPSRQRNRSVLHRCWNPQLNRSVDGTPLRAGSVLYGWGFGVHGENSLDFQLPRFATQFRTQAGLAPRSGGRVRMHVSVARADKRQGRLLFSSGVLQGGRKAASSPSLALPKTSQELILRLAVDSLSRTSSPDGDPLDIRDSANWLDPQIVLDRRELARQVKRRLSGKVTAWQGWRSSPLTSRSPLAGYLDAQVQRGANYRFAVRSPGGMSLSRRIHVRSAAWKVLVASARPPDSDRALLQIRVQETTGEQQEQTIGRQEVPVRYTGEEEPVPLVASLGSWSGKTVLVKVALLPVSQKQKNVIVDWRALSITDQPVDQLTKTAQFSPAREQAGPTGPPSQVGLLGEAIEDAGSSASKDAHNRWLELQVLLQAGYIQDACRLIIETPPHLLLATFADPQQNNHPRTLAALFPKTVAENPQLQQALQRTHAARGVLRLKAAIAESHWLKVHAVRLQFPGTTAAAQANLWLADRDLSAGRFREAEEGYRKAIRPLREADRPAILARLQLAEALGQGKPISPQWIEMITKSP